MKDKKRNKADNKRLFFFFSKKQLFRTCFVAAQNCYSIFFTNDGKASNGKMNKDFKPPAWDERLYILYYY